MLRCYGGMTAIVTVVSGGHMSIVTPCFNVSVPGRPHFTSISPLNQGYQLVLAAIFAPSIETLFQMTQAVNGTAFVCCTVAVVVDAIVCPQLATGPDWAAVPKLTSPLVPP